MILDGLQFEPLHGDKTPPTVARPTRGGIRLANWVLEHRDALDQYLERDGALLFRDFDIADADDFRRVACALGRELGDYDYRSTPRTEVGSQIYTATEYPKRATIPLHNEEAYSADWPLRLMFCCLQPADEGGETPLALTRNVTARIPQELRSRFEKLGVLYVRNLKTRKVLGFDEPWTTVFQSDNQADVEARCLFYGIDWQWGSSDELRLHHHRQASALHPKTGEVLWFNQSHLFHMSRLPRPTQDKLLKLVGEEGLPRNCYYGDGSSIDPQDIQTILDAYQHEARAFPWQRGDFLLLDNMLTCHGRNPFSGKRNVLVAMSGSFAETHTPTIPNYDIANSSEAPAHAG